MSFENRVNFGYGQVATAPAPAISGTTLTLASGAGALFPATDFSIVAYPPNTDPLASNAEICFVSSRTGDVLTMTRAQQGTTARSIAIGWQIANAITTKDFNDIETAIMAGGTVTSVGLTAPAIFAVTGSPVTGAGSLGLTLENESANEVLAGPASGAAATPAFRSLVEDDIPAITESKLSLSDVTTDDVSTSRHGFAPKLSNVSTEYLSGTGVYSTPAVAVGALLIANNLSDVASASTSFGNIKQAATIAATGVVELATVAEAGLGTDTSRAVTPAGLYPSYSTVASASTANIGAASTSRVVITGVTTITAFDSTAEGIVRNIVFSGVLTLTHNAVSLILPGGANITTAIGDCCTAVSEGSGVWRVTIYQRANGTALVGGAAAWGAITGTLSSQTDLQSALDAKQPILTQSALTYAGTTNIDLTGADYQTLALTGNVTFTTSNKAAARSKTVIITCDATPRTFIFPSWVWIGAGAPSGIAASKKGVLSLTCLGSADTDIIAVYSIQNP